MTKVVVAWVRSLAHFMSATTVTRFPERKDTSCSLEQKLVKCHIGHIYIYGHIHINTDGRKKIISIGRFALIKRKEIPCTLPTTPTTVKMQAATAAKTVAGREKRVGLTAAGGGGGGGSEENTRTPPSIVAGLGARLRSYQSSFSALGSHFWDSLLFVCACCCTTVRRAQ